MFSCKTMKKRMIIWVKILHYYTVCFIILHIYVAKTGRKSYFNEITDISLSKKHVKNYLKKPARFFYFVFFMPLVRVTLTRYFNVTFTAKTNLLTLFTLKYETPFRLYCVPKIYTHDIQSKNIALLLSQLGKNFPLKSW